MSSKKQESKVIVLGLSQSGKTSIRQVIFEGFAPEATAQNPATVRINRKLFNLAGSGINLLDIGGQTNYLNELFQQYKERTFAEVKAAIFVVDVSDAANIMRSKYYFDLTLQTLNKLSNKARLYVFAHKMDVVPLNKRESIIKSISDIFEIDKHENAGIFGTSIFDETVWEAMQQVLSYVFPRDTEKSIQVKEAVGNHNLSFLALSTSQGLVLYSEPEVDSGVNYTRMKNELMKAYFPGMILTQATFSFGGHLVYMKELDEDLIITTVFPKDLDYIKSQKIFDEISGKLSDLFKPEELLGQAKSKMRQTVAEHIRLKGIKNIQDIERKLETKISVRCDKCGKAIQRSILDVAIENSEQLDRGLRITTGMGVSTVEIFPTHECIEGIREIPITLDQNLEYRRYEKSRPI
ncbi:MAG: hypothetical protein EAX90_13985 [Candidatus Heimdallarchaeota archaeon]|nr:hypothetical protein [Candidatus Heimdallarchaeota archaeon]